MRDLPVPVIAAINGPAVSCTCFVEDRSHCWWFARLPLILHVSGWSWPLPCSGRGRYQSCLGFSQVSIFPISNIRVTFSAAGFLLFQLFCTSLTWICVLCNEYGQWSSFWIQSKSIRMGVTFTKLGLHPGMAATHFLPALVGPQVMGQFFGSPPYCSIRDCIL